MGFAWLRFFFPGAGDVAGGAGAGVRGYNFGQSVHKYPPTLDQPSNSAYSCDRHCHIPRRDEVVWINAADVRGYRRMPGRDRFCRAGRRRW
jgi:hypothetical protein